jgi:hypothetical protein
VQLGDDPLRVTAVHLKNEQYVNDDIVKATSMELVNTMKDLLNMNPLYGEQFKTLMSLTGTNTNTNTTTNTSSSSSSTRAIHQGIHCSCLGSVLCCAEHSIARLPASQPEWIMFLASFEFT